MDKSPDAFRTISEAAEELDLPQHVLRFWETRFSQIKPLKRGGGRRYYRPQEHRPDARASATCSMTRDTRIKGVQKLLRENGNQFVVAIGRGDVAAVEAIAQSHQGRGREDRLRRGGSGGNAEGEAKQALFRPRPWRAGGTCHR